MCLEEISASFLTELSKTLSVVGKVTEAIGREASFQMSKIKSHPLWPQSNCNSVESYKEEQTTRAVHTGAAPTGFVPHGQVNAILGLFWFPCWKRAFAMQELIQGSTADFVTKDRQATLLHSFFPPVSLLLFAPTSRKCTCCLSQ